MSSALAAFAQAHQGESAPPEVDDDVAAGEGDMKAQQNAKPNSALAAFAQSQQEPASKGLTLVDVANEQTASKPSLLEVARSEGAKKTSLQLSAIAAEVQAEEQEAAQLRTQQIEREIAVTSKDVKQETHAKQQSQVAEALRDAVREEQRYNQTEDEFEQDDPSLQDAAARVVEATSGKPKDKPKHSGALSVDRHLLKQRQQRRGLEAQSKSTAKAKTLKEKVSSFQFQQLSLTQRRVFLAMLVEEPRGEQSKKKCNMHAIEQLAQDRAAQTRQKQKLLKIQPPKYAKLDDNRHCRFKPKIKSVETSRARDDDDDGGSNQRREDFIRRMEATERVRTEQLRRTRAEREYNALVDKKECSQCGNPQSYAELTQKRKKCPNCGVAYKSRLAWSEIADEFLERMAAHLNTQLVPNNQQDHEVPLQKRGPAKLWRDVRDEFLGRVQLDLMQREMSKELILQELEAQCTFSPQISERAKRLQLGDFDERLRRDLENRRVRQEQYRVLSNAIARAEASRAAKGKPVGRLQRSFEQRLQKDLEQRRERLAANDNPKLRNYPSGKSRGLYKRGDKKQRRANCNGRDVN